MLTTLRMSSFDQSRIFANNQSGCVTAALQERKQSGGCLTDEQISLNFGQYATERS